MLNRVRSAEFGTRFGTRFRARGLDRGVGLRGKNGDCVGLAAALLTGLETAV
jgi:hypothetical protein